MKGTRRYFIGAYWTQLSSKVGVSKARKSSRKTELSESELLEGCRLGIDSHADVTCVGRHARILSVVDGLVSTVHPFNDSYEPMRQIKTVNAAFATQTSEGETVILILNNSLDFTHNMEHSLLCTNQARSNGVVVDDVPFELDHKGSSSYSIFFPEMGVSIPLKLKKNMKSTFHPSTIIGS